jgi:hypothetical protein
LCCDPKGLGCPRLSYFARLESQPGLFLSSPLGTKSQRISAVQFSTDGMQVSLKFAGETLVDVTPVSFKKI